MRKKSEAQIFLEQVEKLDVRIRNKLIEKQQWKDIALGITASTEGERVQSSGSQSKMENAIIKCVDMEAEIDRLVDELVETKKKVIQVIESLDNAVEYDVLHRRYIQHQDLQEIADHYGYEYGWATTTHGRALKGVKDILERRANEGTVAK